MASIADLLGVQWEQDSSYSLHPHAAKQAALKGFDQTRVLRAANDPQHTYDNGRYPGQKRHVRDGLVAVVDPRRRQVVTVYEDQKETALRADQTDAAAQKYGRKIASRV